MRALPVVPGLLAGLVDLVLPARCAACGASLAPASALVCPDCRHQLRGPGSLAWPSPAPGGLPPPWAVADYCGSPRALIVAYKEHRRRALASVLGEALAEAVVAAVSAGRPSEVTFAHDSSSGGGQRPGGGAVTQSGPALALAPAPSRRSGALWRGYSSAGPLANTASAVLRSRGYDARVVDALGYARSVVDQSGLRAGERAVNLWGAFAVSGSSRRALRGRRVIVVDDVITTGATIAEAARALRAAGADVSAAAVVAATPRRARPAARGRLLVRREYSL